MAKSTERHAREKLAKIGKSLSVSTTSIRRCKFIAGVFMDGEEALASGKYKTNELYKLAKQDRRVGLHVLIAPELRNAIKACAREDGKTVNELLNDVLTKIFWYDPAEVQNE